MIELTRLTTGMTSFRVMVLEILLNCYFDKSYKKSIKNIFDRKNKQEVKKYYFRLFQIISDVIYFDCFNFCSIYIYKIR